MSPYEKKTAKWNEFFDNFSYLVHANQKMHAKIFLRAEKYFSSNIFRPHEKILKTRFSEAFF